MKIKGFFLAGVLACTAQLACAQDGAAVAAVASTPPSAPPEFLLVLKTDKKTLIVDPDKQDMVAYESSVDTNWVQSIEMISGEEAISRYGFRGRNGAIIIQFKPNYVLPLSLPEASKNGE